MTNLVLPVPTIDSTSSYDRSAQQLHLVITYPSQDQNWPKRLEVYTITTSSPTPTPFGNGKPTFVGSTGTLVLDFPVSLAVQEPQIIVAALHKWEPGPPSDPWPFPQITSASAPSVSLTSDGSVQVDWSCVPTMVTTAQSITLSLTGQEGSINNSVVVQYPTTVATFTMAQAENKFVPGQKVTIQYAPVTAGVPGTPSTITYAIPSSGCKPFSLIVSTPMAPGMGACCAMTSLSPAGTNTMQVWWAATGAIIESVEFPYGSWLDTAKQQSQKLANLSTGSDMCSCLTSISGSKNQQVWWVTGRGAINGQCNTGQGWGSPSTGPGQPDFNKPGTASANSGGSITSVSTSDGGAVLWWVGSKGGISNARWSNGNWQSSFAAAPSGTASVSPMTQLTAQSVGSNVHVFCVSSDGKVVGATWPDFNSSGYTGVYDIAQSGSASPEGGLVSVGISSQKIALFWTTPQRNKQNIEMAILTSDSSASSGWSIQQQPLTVPGSILAQGGITACLTANSQCSVWWIGQCLDLRRTEVNFTEATATGTINWPVFEELGPGSCKQGRSIVAQKISQGIIELLYVNNDGVVAGLSYGSS
ncbi:uncharacterized protein FRV6_02816 [Fusarium oxysporum]|uniref:Fucose-specific lectin n=1 Tax=Fusarium oxysporum TaxID=5507 RepID=A0A2H3TA50_FUSOX|nr:uncharacterized protein FRV6_02816 [Fusarium oxysporum]